MASQGKQRVKVGLQPSKQHKPSASLSKVRLTRRVLKELDRRTNQANFPQHPTFTPRRITRNTLKEIQNFARDGGPDLSALRGVGLNYLSISTLSFLTSGF